MQAIFEAVLDHVRGAWRFRWWAMLAAWVVCLVGWAVVLVIPDTYEASARVFVDTRTTLSDLTRGIVVESSVNTQIQRVRQALLGGPELEKVAQETGIVSETFTPQERQMAVAQLRDRIVISGGLSGGEHGAGVYVISFKDESRERSLRVVDRLVNTFMESTLGGKREGSQQAQRFLIEQIGEYERRLAAAESKLADFKKQNVGLMPGAQGDYFSRLQTEMDTVTKNEAALRIALQRRDEIQRQLNTGSPLMSSAVAGRTGPGDGTDTASRIRDTQARLDDLLLRFTEKHPDVIALRATLADLKERQKEDIEAARRGDPGAAAGSGLSANPVYQSIQLQLNQADIEIAAMRAEISDRQARIASLRRLVDTAPEVEAEFARLNRDYDVTKAQYQSLVERLERAKFSDEAEQTGSVRMEIIDPTSASFSPVAPNRSLLILAVLVLGIGAGGALAYLLHQLKPVFSTPRQLAAVTGLQVLGVVSMTWLEKYNAHQRRGLLMYAGSAALLIFVAAAVFLVHPRVVQALQTLSA
jgi:polysaccharide chain length determinant protein (PEP-CTERM system associated)